MSVMTMTPDLTQGGRHRAPAKSGMRGNPWWTLAAVSIGVIMVGLDASVVAIASKRAGGSQALIDALQPLLASTTPHERATPPGA